LLVLRERLSRTVLVSTFRTHLTLSLPYYGDSECRRDAEVLARYGNRGHFSSRRGSLLASRFKIQIINSARRPSFELMKLASTIDLSFSLLAPLNQALIPEIAVPHPCLPWIFLSKYRSQSSRTALEAGREAYVATFTPDLWSR
jgi:hypothetical protein